MGRALAHQLAAEGAEVFITDINESSVNETAQQIIAKGGKCKAFVVDSASEKEIYDFKEKFLAEEKFVDVLLNNAGMALGVIKFLDVKEEHLKKIVDVNMWGVIHFTRASRLHIIWRAHFGYSTRCTLGCRFNLANFMRILFVLVFL